VGCHCRWLECLRMGLRTGISALIISSTRKCDRWTSEELRIQGSFSVKKNSVERVGPYPQSPHKGDKMSKSYRPIRSAATACRYRVPHIPHAVWAGLVGPVRLFFCFLFSIFCFFFSFFFFLSFSFSFLFSVSVSFLFLFFFFCFVFFIFIFFFVLI
jgi:hypothetical protein